MTSSEKQIPQVVEKPESGDKRKEALERADYAPKADFVFSQICREFSNLQAIAL